MAVSRFGIAWMGDIAIDVEPLAVDEDPTPNAAKPGYSVRTAEIFDRAAGIARKDGAASVEIVHLLAAFAPETGGLMGELKRRHSFDGAAWRANLARWPKKSKSSESLQVPPATPIKELLTPEEASDVLGLHIQTVRGYVRSGRLPALRVAGERVIRIRRADLFGLLEPVEVETEENKEER